MERMSSAFVGDELGSWHHLEQAVLCRAQRVRVAIAPHQQHGHRHCRELAREVRRLQESVERLAPDAGRHLQRLSDDSVEVVGGHGTREGAQLPFSCERGGDRIGQWCDRRCHEVGKSGIIKGGERAHQCEALHAVRVVDDEPLRHAGPHRVTHDDRGAETHRIHEREQIRPGRTRSGNELRDEADAEAGRQRLSRPASRRNRTTNTSVAERRTCSPSWSRKRVCTSP